MTGIEKITARIQADAQQEIDAVLAEANSQAADINARYAAQAKQAEAEILEKGQQSAAELRQRLNSNAQMLSLIHICIRIYMGFRDHEPLEGILDVVPWWIVFAGIAVLVFCDTPLVLILGALSLILTQGRHKEGGIIKNLMGGITSLYDLSLIHI